MIAIGDDMISDITLGKDVICKVCKGEDVIFENVYIPPLPSEIGTNNSMNYAYLSNYKGDYITRDNMNIFRNNVYCLFRINDSIQFIDDFGFISYPKVFLVDSHRSVSIGNTKSSGSSSDIPYPMGIIEFDNEKYSNYHRLLFNDVNPSLADANTITIDDIMYPRLDKLIEHIIKHHSSTEDTELYNRFCNTHNTNKISQFKLTLYTTTVDNDYNSKRRASNVILTFLVNSYSSEYRKFEVTYEVNPNANSVGV